MTIIHTIELSAVRRGDHVYVRQGFFNRTQKQGIIVAGSDVNERHEGWMVIQPRQQTNNTDFELCLVTLEHFVNSSLKLRRVLYDQGDVFLHHLKLRRTSYIQSRVSVLMLL